MCVTVCGKFVSDEGAVAGYGNRIRDKSPAKWGVQIAGMIFQTSSGTGPVLFLGQKMIDIHGYHLEIKSLRKETAILVWWWKVFS